MACRDVRWESIGWLNEVLVAPDGRIIAEIQGSVYGSRWRLYGGAEYISRASAKAAAEAREGCQQFKERKDGVS